MGIKHLAVTALVVLVVMFAINKITLLAPVRSFVS